MQSAPRLLGAGEWERVESNRTWEGKGMVMWRKREEEGEAAVVRIAGECGRGVGEEGECFLLIS